MKLRESIRRPERFDREQLNTPLQKPLREPRSWRTSRYIDYDPNLPPAVFPTLERPYNTHLGDDEPQPAGLERSDEPEKVQWDGDSDDLDGGNDQAKETWEMLEDVPIDFLEDLIVSNGDLNSVYVRNMTKMATAGRKPASLVEMEDSEPDETMADVGMQGTEVLSPMLYQYFLD